MIRLYKLAFTVSQLSVFVPVPHPKVHHQQVAVATRKLSKQTAATSLLSPTDRSDSDLSQPSDDNSNTIQAQVCTTKKANRLFGQQI